jgi:hypothetical protein
MIRDVILKYYGTHTCFDTVSCYLDGVDNQNPTILDMNGDRKPINSVLCFRDEGYWTVKFLEFSPKDIAPLINTLNQKPFISVLHIDEPFSSIIPGETKIPYVCDGEEESELVQQGKINLSQCIKGELYLSGKIKDVYFDEDEEKRGIEIIDYTEIIKDWRSFAKRGTGDSEHYGTEFKSFKTPKVEIIFLDKSVKFYNDIREVKELLDSFEKKMTLDYHKPYNNRDPDSLYKWIKNEDGTFESCNIFHLIDFFNENEKGKQRHCSKEFHFCECDFEYVIKESNDPDLMRVFLTAANIIDETIFHLLNDHYKEFRTIFPLPRYESHEKRGEVGNINLIHKRNLNEQDSLSYNQFNYEVSSRMIDDIRFYRQTETQHGFLAKITDNSEVSNQYKYDSFDVAKCMHSQSKMCVMAPLFYSALRREIKTNKKVLF